MNTIFFPLLENGIPLDVVYFLLLIPFIVMVATIARHVVGIKIYSVFAVVGMTLAIAFLLRSYSLLSAGMGFGILLLVYFLSYWVKRFTNDLGLHYLSRISVVVSIISLVLLLVLLVAGRYTNLVSFLQLDKLSPFALVYAVLLSEFFSSNQSQKGFRASRVQFSFSLLLSLVLGFMISLDQFENILLKFPFLALLFVFGTFFAGQYRGLRVTELQRFKDIEVDDEE